GYHRARGRRFFIPAEDGIRASHVTGVQTCALPIFTDELGGGGAATCNPEIGPELGADGIYDIVGKGDERKLVFRSFFKIDREQTDEENCVAHNGMLLPVPGKDIMVQSWYMGGTAVWDFTDSSNPKQIGYVERGPAANPEE